MTDQEYIAERKRMVKESQCYVCKKRFPKDGKAGNAVWAHKCTERISAHMTWEEMGSPSGR